MPCQMKKKKKKMDYTCTILISDLCVLSAGSVVFVSLIYLCHYILPHLGAGIITNQPEMKQITVCKKKTENCIKNYKRFRSYIKS